LGTLEGRGLQSLFVCSLEVEEDHKNLSIELSFPFSSREIEERKKKGQNIFFFHSSGLK